MDTHLWCKKGTIDLDDPYKKDEYDSNIEMWQRFDCFTKNILTTVEDVDELSNIHFSFRRIVFR